MLVAFVIKKLPGNTAIVGVGRNSWNFMKLLPRTRVGHPLLFVNFFVSYYIASLKSHSRNCLVISQIGQHVEFRAQYI